MQCTTEVSNILLPPRGHRMLQFHFYSQDVDGWTNVGHRELWTVESSTVVKVKYTAV